MGPKKDFKTVEERTKTIVDSVAKEHQAKLQTVLAEYRDVFRDELPKGPPPRREVVHSIEVQPGSEPTYRTPYRLRPAEQDELEEQVKESSCSRFYSSKPKSVWSSGIVCTEEGWAMANVH